MSVSLVSEIPIILQRKFRSQIVHSGTYDVSSIRNIFISLQKSIVEAGIIDVRVEV